MRGASFLNSCKKANKMRLNAFRCYCLKRILKIPPSFVSRITNNYVLEHRQIRVYKPIRLLPVDSLVRRLVCDCMGRPINWCRRRSRGRPRQRWVQVFF